MPIAQILKEIARADSRMPVSCLNKHMGSEPIVAHGRENDFTARVNDVYHSLTPDASTSTQRKFLRDIDIDIATLIKPSHQLVATFTPIREADCSNGHLRRADLDHVIPYRATPSSLRPTTLVVIRKSTRGFRRPVTATSRAGLRTAALRSVRSAEFHPE